MTRKRGTSRLRHACLVLAVLFTMLDGDALAQGAADSVAAGGNAVDSVSVDRLSHDQLRATYLRCSSEAVERKPARADVVYCSTVYEALKQRVFGGDFEALIAWLNPGRPGPAGRDDGHAIARVASGR